MTKNFRGITLTAIDPKDYNTLHLNCIQADFEKILRNKSEQLSNKLILTIRRIIEGVRAKNLEATQLFVDFSKAFESILRGKMEQTQFAYDLSKETDCYKDA